MTNYEFIKSIEQNYFLELIKRGIIPVHIMDYVLIYETYLTEIKTNKPTLSVAFVSEKYNISESTVWRIIKFMNI